MSNEPEREIEKTLRASAQQRREAAGAPTTMHPATRKLLQGEVARTYATGRGDAGSKTFRFSWPRLMAVVGAIILLGWVGSVFLLRSSKAPFEYQLAKNKSESTLKTSPAYATPNAPADKSKDAASAAPGSSLNQNGIVTETLRQHSNNFEDFGTGISESAARDLKKELPSPNLDALVAAKPMSVPALSVPSVSYDGTTPGGSITTDSSNTSSNVATLQFASVNQPNAAQRSAGSLATPRALNSFRVEQTGDQIRVVDGDGSIYAGYVEKAEASAKTPASLDENKSRQLGEVMKNSVRLAGTATNASLAQMTQSYFFRVSGTNLTLHQELIFSGHFVGVATVPIASPSPLANGAVSSDLSAEPAPAPLQLLNCRVTGRAVIGSTNQMEINAQATTNPSP